MEIPKSQKWMYNRLNERKSGITDEFVDGVVEFIQFVANQVEYAKCNLIRCLCVKCKCKAYKLVDDIKVHLFSKQFMPKYYHWTCHGET